MALPDAETLVVGGSGFALVVPAVMGLLRSFRAGEKERTDQFIAFLETQNERLSEDRAAMKTAIEDNTAVLKEVLKEVRKPNSARTG